MRAVCAALLIAAASGQNGFTNFKLPNGFIIGYKPHAYKTNEPGAPGSAVPACDADSTFFEKGIGSAIYQHPEYKEDKIKMALGQQMKFMQIDQPFSHKANAISMSLIEENDQPESDKFAAKRAALRAKKSWSGSKVEQEKMRRAAELRQEKAQAEDEAAKRIDVWYVNMANARERKNCLERQFRDMPGNVQANRYGAVEFPEKCLTAAPGKAYEQCLKDQGVGDCIEAGIDYASTASHGSRAADEGKIRNSVISNWCGHKRLFQKIEADAKNDTGHAKYAVILEDDVVLDRKYFMTVLQDFATKYENRDWDFVQIDPFGHKDRKDLLEHWRGKPVFKPASDGQCSAYWGFHAVLVKVSALERINHWMKVNQAIPIDWLPWRMPHGLAYSALISRNPEAALNGNVIVLPEYCSSKVMKSTIGSF